MKTTAANAWLSSSTDRHIIDTGTRVAKLVLDDAEKLLGRVKGNDVGSVRYDFLGETGT
jgi:hypothetical protein